MRKTILNILLLIVASVSLSASAQTDEKLVSYPMPPDSIMQLQPRCDYIISRYWHRCRFDYAMSHPDKFNEAFGAWVALLPYASADTVHAAIDNLLAKFVKKGPETLTLANMARGWLYADTSQYRSDELYMPFALAASKHKKIKKEQKVPFEADYKRMSSSAVGSIVPPIEIISPDGTKGSFSDIKGRSILVFFNEPDNVDCSVTRIRLSANPNVRELIERGELTVVCVHPGEPGEEWKTAAASLPEAWHKVAMPAAHDYFDLRIKPQLVYLNGGHKVLAKNLGLPYLLGAFEVANKKNKNTSAANE